MARLLGWVNIRRSPHSNSKFSPDLLIEMDDHSISLQAATGMFFSRHGQEQGATIDRTASPAESGLIRTSAHPWMKTKPSEKPFIWGGLREFLIYRCSAMLQVTIPPLPRTLYLYHAIEWLLCPGTSGITQIRQRQLTGSVCNIGDALNRILDLVLRSHMGVCLPIFKELDCFGSLLDVRFPACTPCPVSTMLMGISALPR